MAALGVRLAYASPSGSIIAAPPGFIASTGITGTGRLLVTLSADTTWNGLTNGADGQLLEVKIVAGNFFLTLPQAAFNGVGDIVIPLNGGILMYFDSNQGEWEVTSP